MIPFIAKTWFLWWMLAIGAGLRCFHLLCLRNRAGKLDSAAFEEVEEEAAANISSLLLQQQH